MEKPIKRRILFYSKDDLASYPNLIAAQNLLTDYTESKNMTINDHIEIYQVNTYFKNDMIHPEWNEQTVELLKQKGVDMWKPSMQFLNGISNSNFVGLYEEVEILYKKQFWELISEFKIYRRIDAEVITKTLQIYPLQIRNILPLKYLVEYYNESLREHLLTNENSAELLANGYSKSANRKTAYHFPKNLTNADKELIINNYLDKEDANLNYIRLIMFSRDNDLKLSAKTRLRIKKRSQELNNKVFENGSSMRMAAEVIFCQDQEEPVIEENAPIGEIRLRYSEKFLDKQKDDASLFSIFKSLFEFLDQHGFISLVNKKSELVIYERILMESKNAYPMGVNFMQKQNLSKLQLFIFEDYLKKRGKPIEGLLFHVVNEFMPKALSIEGLHIKLPNEHSGYFEKIRIMAPEMEALLKQYQLFVEDGEINFELIHLNSAPLSFKEIKSAVEKKYAYVSNEKLNKLVAFFFSDQNIFAYTEKHGDKHDNFCSLISTEEVSINDYHEYQKPTIHYFVIEGYLSIDENNIIEIRDLNLLTVLQTLHENGMTGYWSHTEEEKEIIDEFVQRGFLKFESTLFAKSETSYLNFYLNKKEFTNGLDIRNKYLHGTNNSSEKDHQQDYYILYNLFVLVVHKIIDDQIIRKKALNKKNESADIR